MITKALTPALLAALVLGTLTPPARTDEPSPQGAEAPGKRLVTAQDAQNYLRRQDWARAAG